MLVLVSPVLACSPGELFSLVAERLSYMPAVAEYKYRRGMLVTDAAREQRVLDNAAAQARELGLPGARVEAMVRAQMEAAKVMQRRLVAQWRQQGLPDGDESADLLATIRPRLNQLGHRQLLLVQCLRGGQARVEPGQRPRFDLAIAGAGAHLPRESADELFRSLLNIAGD
jgi:chorismate mutase